MDPFVHQISSVDLWFCNGIYKTVVFIDGKIDEFKQIGKCLQRDKDFPFPAMKEEIRRSAR